MQPGFPRFSGVDSELTSSIIGCCIRVHQVLGPGLNETAYAKACAIELELAGIAFEAELSIPIRYKGHLIAHHRIDLMVEQRLVLELKSVEAIHSVHVAQVVSYLRATGLRVGLIVNFNVEILRQGLRRVIL